MRYERLGNTGLKVSRLGYGASSLGGVFHAVDEDNAIAAVQAALDGGINYVDAAPSYGGTLAETRLGMGLQGVDRSRYVLSTKVGKTTDPNRYGRDVFDYSRDAIRRSLDESCERLGVDRVDIALLHDIEYQGRAHTEQAMGEGFDTLMELKEVGQIKAAGFAMYPIDLWQRALASHDFDVMMIHNHYCLNDTRLVELLPRAIKKGVGVINAAPLACGLLADRGAPDWHPIAPEQVVYFQRAAAYCREQGMPIAQLAVQFASQHPDIPTTIFSSANADTVRQNIDWLHTPCDYQLIDRVREILQPVRDVSWGFDSI